MNNFNQKINQKKKWHRLFDYAETFSIFLIPWDRFYYISGDIFLLYCKKCNSGTNVQLAHFDSSRKKLKVFNVF